MGSCGHSITLTLRCFGGGTLCANLLLDIHWPDGCGLDQSGMLSESCVCDPLAMEA